VLLVPMVLKGLRVPMVPMVQMALALLVVAMMPLTVP
jgi:hypothetical protein